MQGFGADLPWLVCIDEAGVYLGARVVSDVENVNFEACVISAIGF